MEFVLTELRSACGLRPRSSPATTASTPTFASVSTTSPSEVLSAMNSVAPRVFGETPTPRYLHGTQATTMNCCDEHQNLMRSPYVQGGRPNLREQYVGEMPKSYGFNYLSSQSLFLVDSTERRYFVLPEDYPLEQVTPPMSYSAVEKVGDMAVPSVAAQAAGLAPVLCSNANNNAGSKLLVPNLQQPLNVQDASRVFTETPIYDIYEEEDSSCLNIISDVPDFTLALQQQDDERAFNCSVLMASNSFVTRCSQLSIEHSMREFRLLWDPGASAFLHSSKAEPPRELSYVSIVFPKVLILCNQVGTYVQKLRDSRWNVSVSHEGRKEWDPGDTKLHVLFMVVAGARELQCTDVYKSVMLHILDVQFSAWAPIFESAIRRCYAFGLGWTEVNASALCVLALQYSTGTSLVDEMLQNGSDHMSYPGASAFLVTPLKNCSSNNNIGNENVEGLISGMGDFFFHDKTDLWSQYEHQFLVLRLRGVFEEVMLGIPPAKPPDRHGIADSSPQVILLKVLKDENSSAHTHFNFLSCNSKQLSVIQPIPGNYLSLEAIPSWQRGPFCLGNFAISDLWCNTTLSGVKIFGGLNTAANSQNVLPCISISGTKHICLFVKLSPWTILSAEHFLDSTMKNGSIFSAERSLPCNPRYAILLLLHFLWEFSIRTATRLKWDPGVKVSVYRWLDVLTAWSENDKPLSCTRIPGLATLQTQSVGITASYLWNPGIMLLQYKSIIEEKENVTLIPEQWICRCNNMHYCKILQRCTTMSSLFHCHGIPLWLINFQVP